VRRISHETYASVFGVVYLGLMGNLLLLVGCLPAVAVLLTTDPALSWPVLLGTLPLCAPAFAAAFATFRSHGDGDPRVVRVFFAAWRAMWRKAMLIGLAAAALLAVVLVDVRFFSDLQAGVVLIPVLAVLAVVAVSAATVALTALAEVPAARLRDIAKAALYLSLRRWLLSLVSLAVLAAQIGLFTAMPAFAIGLTAAPALFLVWANARYTLRPVLATDTVAA
jgi:uncharacterized membrane protein YesL